jgi:hypothetical protein
MQLTIERPTLSRGLAAPRMGPLRRVELLSPPSSDQSLSRWRRNWSVSAKAGRRCRNGPIASQPEAGSATLL